MMVVLPQPDAPTRPMRWPRMMLRLQWRSTAADGRVGYAKRTSRNSIAGAPMAGGGGRPAPVDPLMAGRASRRWMMLFVAACALVRFEVKPNRKPAAWPPNTTAMNTTKNWRTLYSPATISRPPYQNASPTPSRSTLSLSPNRSMIHAVRRYALRTGPLSRAAYRSITPSSSVSDCTVRIAPTASDAKRVLSRKNLLTRSCDDSSSRMRVNPAANSSGSAPKMVTSASFQPTTSDSVHDDSRLTITTMISPRLPWIRSCSACGSADNRPVSDPDEFSGMSKKAMSCVIIAVKYSQRCTRTMMNATVVHTNPIDAYATSVPSARKKNISAQKLPRSSSALPVSWNTVTMRENRTA